VKRLAAVLVALLVLGLSALATATSAEAAPGPPGAPEYWFDAWHVQQLWAQGIRGQGVVIAEIDTGVNAQLPALAGKVLSGKDFGSAGGNGQADRERDEFGHGTAMASIMVGRTGTAGIVGTAPGARILPIAIPLRGTTDVGTSDHMGDAIRWAADHGAKIISMSLGGERNSTLDTVSCPADEQAAIDYAINKGAVLLAAGGNRGKLDNAVEQPGVCLGVISVGAVDDKGTVADFSSRHPYLTLGAPGVNIPSLSRIPGDAYHGNGTSQATALASAALALVWSKYPKLTGRQLVARVLATLDKHGDGRSPEYGYGVLNPYRAVTADVPPNAPNPLYAQIDPFLQRAAALQRTAKAAPAPKPVAAAPLRPGEYKVGHASHVALPRVALGSVLAAVGMLGLVALAGLGRRQHQLDNPPPPAPTAPPPATVDESGAVWHEILTEPPPGDDLSGGRPDSGH